MAASSKNHYPTATPLYSPAELAKDSNRLSQWNEELTVQAKRLKEWKSELEERADRLRRWNLGLGIVCAVAVLLALACAWFGFKPTQVTPVDETPQILATSPAPTPTTAPVMSAKPQAADDRPKAQKAFFLEALGGLSVAHLYQSHLNIGLLADGVESETYTIEEAERNLKSVVELMKHIETQHVKLMKSGLDREDQDSIREIQVVTKMLHLQIDALRAYWANEDVALANQYHLARKTSWEGLTKVLGLDK